MINNKYRQFIHGFLFLVFQLICVFPSQSQTLKWATQWDSSNYKADAIVNDEQGNVYSAFNDGTGSTAIFYGSGELKLYSQNAFGESNWEVQFAGTGHILDMLVRDDKLYVLGLLKDSIQIGTQWIYKLENQQYRAFILCMDTSGNIEWITPTPWPENNLLINIEINDQTLYTVGVYEDVKSRLDSWDLNGNLLQSKTFDDLRTLSDIDFDSMNNIYLSGTGEPNGNIDTVEYNNSTPPSSYLIFLIKLNSDWQAQWVHLEYFITFDFSPQIEIINDSIYLAYMANLSQGGGQINIDIQAFDQTGQSLLVQNSEHSNGIFHFTKTIDNGVENLMLSKQDYLIKPVYIQFFNSQLIETRTDSIYKLNVEAMQLAGGIDQYSVALSSYDSLWCNNQFAFDLTNLNFIQSNVTLCVSDLSVGIENAIKQYTFKVFPNPASHNLHISGLNEDKYLLKIFDINGNEHPTYIQAHGDDILLDVSTYPTGMYFLFDEINNYSTSFFIQ